MARQRASTDALFTKDDYKLLIETRRALNDLIVKCDKAEQCGVNVAVWRQQREDLDKQLAAIQQLFMTPAPG